MYSLRIAVVTVLALLSGCSTSSNFKPTPGGDKTLYETAVSKVGKDDKEAIEDLSNIEIYYPGFEKMDEAILLKLELLYNTKELTEAEVQADRFISLYPSHPKTAYAYYLKGMCSYKQMMDSSRDQRITEDALTTFETLKALFPNCEYIPDVNEKILHCRNILGVKELEVGRFYAQRGNTAAAISRFKNVLNEYSETVAAPEAIYRIVESYINIKSFVEAKRYYEALKAKYPDSIWLEKARKIMPSA